jgi:hypothetical protein
MTRALSLTCAALLLVGLGGSAFAGKPTIAVLGLEVVDQSGTPTAADTQAAKELTDGLRARAKAGTGPYQLAPQADKELIDQKLLNNCDSEAPACMSAIGNQLGADILMYGRLEKQGKAYNVAIKVLDVGKKTGLKSWGDAIPLSEASGDSLRGWAKKIYAKLTGESTSGTIVVNVTNAQKGTILIDGDQRGTFSNGTGSVQVEGKVRIGVEADGFPRWERDVTVSNGGTQTLDVELAGLPPPPPPPPGKGSGKVLWGSIAAGGLLIAAGSGYWWYHNYGIIKDVRNEQCANGYENGGCTPAKIGVDITQQQYDDYTNNRKKDADKRGDDASDQTLYGAIGVGIGVGVMAIGIVKFASSSSDNPKEHATRGKRVRKDRPFVVTPIVSPNGGGATLRIDW